MGDPVSDLANPIALRLAEAGRVLLLAHRRLLAKSKMNARHVVAAADAKLSKGEQSHAISNDT